MRSSNKTQCGTSLLFDLDFIIVAETHQEPQIKASTVTLNGVKEQLHKGHVKVERGERTCCALMRKKKKPTTVQIFQSGAEGRSTRACGLSSLLQGPGSLMYSPYTHYSIQPIQYIQCILPPPSNNPSDYIIQLLHHNQSTFEL